jgi:hypothetical protein
VQVHLRLEGDTAGLTCALNTSCWTLMAVIVAAASEHSADISDIALDDRCRAPVVAHIEAFRASNRFTC